MCDVRHQEDQEDVWWWWCGGESIAAETPHSTLGGRKEEQRSRGRARGTAGGRVAGGPDRAGVTVRSIP